MTAKGDEVWTQLATRIPKGTTPPPQAALRDPRHVGHGVRGRRSEGEAGASGSRWASGEGRVVEAVGRPEE